MIECVDLSVSYDNKKILDKANLLLPAKCFTAVIGKNGTGKSTLVRCILQQQKYTGKILLDSSDVRTFSPRQLAQKIAFLPQILPCPDITVRELAEFGRNPHIEVNQHLSAADKTAIDKALLTTGMQASQHRSLSTLSGGERQKAFLSMILAQQTDILILDEPTSYMDIVTEIDFLQLLKSLSDRGKTIIAVLHNLSLAVRFADNIVILDKHQCVYSGKTQDCLSTKRIESFFGVRRVRAQESLSSEIFFTA